MAGGGATNAPSLPVWATFASSAVSASFAEGLTLPLDTAKVRLQLQGAAEAGKKLKYNGLLGTCATVAKEEGMGALWKVRGAPYATLARAPTDRRRSGRAVRQTPCAEAKRARTIDPKPRRLSCASTRAAPLTDRGKPRPRAARRVCRRTPQAALAWH